MLRFAFVPHPRPRATLYSQKSIFINYNCKLHKAKMMNESDSHDEQQLEENPSSAENSLMDDSGVEEEASQQNQTPNVVDLDKSDPDYEIPNAALAIQQQPKQQQNTDLGNFPFRELLAFFRVQMNTFVANFNPGLLIQSFRLQAQAFLFRLFQYEF